MPPAHSSPRSAAPGDDGSLVDVVEERCRDRTSGQAHTHSLRRNGTSHHPRTGNPDPSCLLTPPNTPLYPDGSGPGSMVGPNGQTNGCLGRSVTESKKSNGIIPNGLEGRSAAPQLWSTQSRKSLCLWKGCEGDASAHDGFME